MLPKHCACCGTPFNARGVRTDLDRDWTHATVRIWRKELSEPRHTASATKELIEKLRSL